MSLLGEIIGTNYEKGLSVQEIEARRIRSAIIYSYDDPIIREVLQRGLETAPTVQMQEVRTLSWEPPMGVGRVVAAVEVEI